jgi:hypothetical protein
MNGHARRGTNDQSAGIRWVAAGPDSMRDSARNWPNRWALPVAAGLATAARAIPGQPRNSDGHRPADQASRLRPLDWPAVAPPRKTSRLHGNEQIGHAPCCRPRRFPPAIAAEEKQSGATAHDASRHHTTQTRPSGRWAFTADGTHQGAEQCNQWTGGGKPEHLRGHLVHPQFHHQHPLPQRIGINAAAPPSQAGLGE